MSHHVFIYATGLPDKCPGKDRIDKINESSNRPAFAKVKEMDIKDCFYCPNFRRIARTMVRTFLLFCEDGGHIRTVPITVE